MKLRARQHATQTGQITEHNLYSATHGRGWGGTIKAQLRVNGWEFEGFLSLQKMLESLFISNKQGRFFIDTSAHSYRVKRRDEGQRNKD